MKRIVSGGQTGVDRAALDVAIDLGIGCGGWCPAGRLAEDGAISSEYPLKETPASEYAERTEWNIRDSDGTLVLTIGTPTDGTHFTVFLAARMAKPCLIVDFNKDPDAEHVRNWIAENRINTLNVAGPRASKFPSIYDKAVEFLHNLFDERQAGSGRTQ